MSGVWLDTVLWAANGVGWAGAEGLGPLRQCLLALAAAQPAGSGRALGIKGLNGGQCGGRGRHWQRRTRGTGLVWGDARRGAQGP